MGFKTSIRGPWVKSKSSRVAPDSTGAGEYRALVKHGKHFQKMYVQGRQTNFLRDITSNDVQEGIFLKCRQGWNKISHGQYEKHSHGNGGNGRNNQTFQKQLQKEEECSCSAFANNVQETHRALSCAQNRKSERFWVNLPEFFWTQTRKPLNRKTRILPFSKNEKIKRSWENQCCHTTIFENSVPTAKGKWKREVKMLAKRTIFCHCTLCQQILQYCFYSSGYQRAMSLCQVLFTSMDFPKLVNTYDIFVIRIRLSCLPSRKK